MTMRDEDLRKNRLVFYEDHIQTIQEICQALLDKSKAKAAMLVDKEGHLISMNGKTSVDAETVSALVAGSFAATQQIAKLFGEDEFSMLFHKGKKESIQFSLVGDRMLLVIVFDEESTPGMVRLYSDQTVKKLNEVLADIKANPREDQGMGEGFAAEADKNLDDLFG